MAPARGVAAPRAGERAGAGSPSSSEALALPIVNEENGKTETVKKWGVRVPEATFEAIRADKSDDGIVENNVLGEKHRGSLKVDYLMDVEDGTITAW